MVASKLFNGIDVNDEFYSNHEARLDTIIGDKTHAIQLKKCKEEWDQLAEEVAVGQGFLAFHDYVRINYGISMEYNGDDISLEYQILDEQKYTIFLLKFN